jgi:hypothetical protein
VPGEVEVKVVAPNGDVLVVLTGWVIPVVLFPCTDESGTDLVVIFLGALADVIVVVAVDMWAEAERIEGVIAPVVVLDFAWKVGLLRARKAEKKLAKKGR